MINDNIELPLNFNLIEEIHILNAKQEYLLEKVTNWYNYLKNNINKDIPYIYDNPTNELINGVYRLIQALLKEGLHLKHLINNEELIQPHHLTCSNLPYLEAIYYCAQNQKGLISIFKTFNYYIRNNKEDSPIHDKICVDIVCNNGYDWIKVSARNEKYLTYESNAFKINNYLNDVSNLNLNELTEFEFKIFQLKWASFDNQIHFKIPNIRFQFTSISFNNQFHFPLINGLINLNIIPEKCELNPVMKNNFDIGDFTKLSTDVLNLDCTTLIALCSELTNSFNENNLRFNPENYKEANALKVQVEQELNKPLLPILSHLIKGKVLTTTRTCYNKFISITNTLAGSKEKLRAKILFRDFNEEKELYQYDNTINDPFMNFKIYNQQLNPPVIQVLDDIISPTFQELLHIKFHKLYNEFHSIIYGSGYERKFTTITANSWITRSLLDLSPKLNDINFLLIHEPRSFVENKL